MGQEDAELVILYLEARHDLIKLVYSHLSNCSTNMSYEMSLNLATDIVDDIFAKMVPAASA